MWLTVITNMRWKLHYFWFCIQSARQQHTYVAELVKYVTFRHDTFYYSSIKSRVKSMVNAARDTFTYFCYQGQEISHPTAANSSRKHAYIILTPLNPTFV